MSRLAWITDDWRLKVLALGLAILMLGAVAFSQNPPTTKTLQVSLQYSQVGPTGDLVILNPPASVSVTFSGLADTIGSANANNFSAAVDATHASAGPAVRLNVTVVTTLKVDIQAPAPIVVRIDHLKAVDLPVHVSAHGAPGFTVTATSATPAAVHFVGPESWESQLAATVNIGTPIVLTNPGFNNQPVMLSNSNGNLSLVPCTTWPCPTLDPTSVDVSVTATSGTNSTTVPLVLSPPSQPPPPGYELTGISISPATVVITGDPAALAKIQRIILPAVDLSGYTGTTKVQINIPYPDGVTPLNGVQIAAVTFTIQRNPSVTPSP